MLMFMIFITIIFFMFCLIKFCGTNKIIKNKKVKKKSNKYFIISKFSDIDLYLKIIEDNKNSKYKLSFDWYKNANEYKRTTISELREYIHADIKGLKKADIVLMAEPCGLDSHVELGVALSLNKKIIILTKDVDKLINNVPCGYYSHKLISFYELEDNTPITIERILNNTKKVK